MTTTANLSITLLLCGIGSAAIAAPLKPSEVSAQVRSLRQGEVRGFKRAFAAIAQGKRPRGYVLVKTTDTLEPERLFKKGTEHKLPGEVSYAFRGDDGNVIVQSSVQRQEPGKSGPTTFTVRFANGARLDGPKRGISRLNPGESRTSGNGASPASRLMVRFYDGKQWAATSVIESDGWGKRNGVRVRYQNTSYRPGEAPSVYPTKK